MEHVHTCGSSNRIQIVVIFLLSSELPSDILIVFSNMPVEHFLFRLWRIAR